MATVTRFSVAKTQKSYSASGVDAVLGSTVKSETEDWNGGVAYPPAKSTSRLTPTSLIYTGTFGSLFLIPY